jgi:glutamate---cysteine ligase / carboxylate-amine ligase
MALFVPSSRRRAEPAMKQPAPMPGYSFGIEEEYFVVDKRSGAVRQEMSQAFLADLHRRFGDQVTTELLQCQVEIGSRPHTSPEEARDELMAFRTGLAEIASGHGLGIVAAGSHPLARYAEFQRTRKRRYAKVIADLQMVGMASAFCGLHVHVELPDPDQRVDVMARMIPFLPVFLALSTSSPFWSGRETGLLSYRSAGNKMLPRTGVPELFRSMKDYQDYVARLVAAKIIPDATHIWWILRPSLLHPTLELRVMDCCTSVRDAVALAMLFRSLARHLFTRTEVNADLTPLSRALTEENAWRAQRYGIEGTYVDVEDGQTRSFKQQLNRLCARVADDAAALGCEAELAHLQAVAARGTSAHRQLALYRALRSAGRPHVWALREVVRWLRLSSEAGDLIAEG